MMKRSGPVARFADRQNAGITPTGLPVPESGLRRVKSDIGRDAFASQVPSPATSRPAQSGFPKEAVCVRHNVEQACQAQCMGTRSVHGQTPRKSAHAGRDSKQLWWSVRKPSGLMCQRVAPSGAKLT
ncbi:hypothetical protein UUC_03410 [Rhodanobacter denitrificans]|nr:hypothetical protein UUC_03410 [Rhodanobacter denitrificans]